MFRSTCKHIIVITLGIIFALVSLSIVPIVIVMLISTGEDPVRNPVEFALAIIGGIATIHYVEKSLKLICWNMSKYKDFERISEESFFIQCLFYAYTALYFVSLCLLAPGLLSLLDNCDIDRHFKIREKGEATNRE